MKILASLTLLLFVLFNLTACIDSPRRQLSSAERSADMAWVFSKFDHNYAPKKYKEDLHSFNYEQLKEHFMAEAQKDQSNEEFYRLVHQFVAHFKDAHVSASMQISPLPGRSRIAYLGFKGVRQGNHLVVTQLLPTIKSANFPIKVGDQISALNGQSLIQSVEGDLLPYLNTGHQQANYTILMNVLFTRSLNQFPEPTADTATLSVLRRGVTEEVQLPWIIKDAAAFNAEQKAAIQASSTKANQDIQSLVMEYLPLVSLTHFSYTRLIDLFLNNQPEELLGQILDYNSKKSYFDSFEYFSSHDVWSQIELMEKFYGTTNPQPAATLVPNRLFAMKSYAVPNTTVFPAVVLIKGPQKEKIGYIKISQFSVPNENLAVAEFKNTIQYFYDLGITKLMIDLIDNGGGSLSLGSRLAQTLSPNKLDMPTMDFKINDSWLDTFERGSLAGSSDSEKEIYGRVFNQLINDMAAGQEISEGYPIEKLFPFALKGNRSIANDQPLKMVLLVNEMCASMCDIFAGILQDNKLAQIFGQQTMGAGGNVTQYFQSPNSGFFLSQTESLIVRSNGEYLENNGVIPDVKFNTFEDINTKYHKSISAAADLLMK